MADQPTDTRSARAQDESRPPREGDWIEVHVRAGEPPRRGFVLEILGKPGHEHYRVRWDEEHEAIFYPAEDARITPLPH